MKSYLPTYLLTDRSTTILAKMQSWGLIQCLELNILFGILRYLKSMSLNHARYEGNEIFDVNFVL